MKLRDLYHNWDIYVLRVIEFTFAYLCLFTRVWSCILSGANTKPSRILQLLLLSHAFAK
jgi:hypothetical protein